MNTPLRPKNYNKDLEDVQRSKKLDNYQGSGEVDMCIKEDHDDSILSKEEKNKKISSQARKDETLSRRSVIRRVATQSMSSVESNVERNLMGTPGKRAD